jgi:hypothetical protein
MIKYVKVIKIIKKGIILTVLSKKFDEKYPVFSSFFNIFELNTFCISIKDVQNYPNS